MKTFNHKLLDSKIGNMFDTNKDCLVSLNNAGVDVKEDAIKKWRQGNSTPKTSYLNTICSVLKIDINELLNIKQPQFNNKDYTMIKAFNVKAGAGEAYIPESLESVKIPIANQFLNGHNPDFLHLIQVTGDSMIPKINDNDWLIVDMLSDGNVVRNFEKIDGLYLIVADDRIQVKHLEFRGNKGVDIISYNSAVFRTKNNLDDNIELEILGKVFKHIKDLGALTISSLD